MRSPQRLLFNTDASAAVTSFPASLADDSLELAVQTEPTPTPPERLKSQQWSQITNALAHKRPSVHCVGAANSDGRMKTPSRRSCQTDFDIENIHVSVLDRPTSSTVLISWKDSTRCNYGYQLWHLAKTRKSGVCALSGNRIKVGEIVYRPYSGRLCPLNAGAMILAISINERTPDVLELETSAERRYFPKSIE
jgi:hypothetical protein